MSSKNFNEKLRLTPSRKLLQLKLGGGGGFRQANGLGAGFKEARGKVGGTVAPR
jgi:hypothetical protein